MMCRGSIWWGEIDLLKKGSEQNGHRPYLIIQNDVGNACSTTVIVAAITDAGKRRMPTHVAVREAVRIGLTKESVVLLEQIRTLDKSRLTDFVGMVSAKTMREVDRALMISLGLVEVNRKGTAS